MKRILALLLVVLCILPVFAGCSAVDAFKEGFQEGLEDGLKGEVGSIEENEDNNAFLKLHKILYNMWFFEIFHKKFSISPEAFLHTGKKTPIPYIAINDSWKPQSPIKR